MCLNLFGARKLKKQIEELKTTIDNLRLQLELSESRCKMLDSVNLELGADKLKLINELNALKDAKKRNNKKSKKKVNK